jgi:hypothetical protein
VLNNLELKTMKSTSLESGLYQSTNAAMYIVTSAITEAAQIHLDGDCNVCGEISARTCVRT